MSREDPPKTGRVIQIKVPPQQNVGGRRAGEADGQAAGGLRSAGLGAQESRVRRADGLPAGDGRCGEGEGGEGRTPSAWRLHTGSVRQAGARDGNHAYRLGEARPFLSPGEPRQLNTGALLAAARLGRVQAPSPSLGPAQHLPPFKSADAPTY